MRGQLVASYFTLEPTEILQCIENFLKTRIQLFCGRTRQNQRSAIPIKIDIETNTRVKRLLEDTYLETFWRPAIRCYI